MGNIIVLAVLVVMFGAILYSMIKTYKIKGTTCTSCTSCPIVQHCDEDTLKQELKAYYTSQK